MALWSLSRGLRVDSFSAFGRAISLPWDCKVQDRRAIDSDPKRIKFIGNQACLRVNRLTRSICTVLSKPAKPCRWRKFRPVWRSESRHAAALLIDEYGRVTSSCRSAKLTDEHPYLVRIFDIAAE